MQPQEYNLVLERLHRFEHRARWHSAERFVTLTLAGWLLVTGPVGASLKKQIARVRPLEASQRARSVLAEGVSAAERALLVRPALDPQLVLEDQREASMDAMPMPPAEAMPAQPARATTATATAYRFHKRPGLLAAPRPISSRTSSSQAMATAVGKAAPRPATENAMAWSSSVSEAERQMARAADNNAEPLASLMDSPLASGALALDGTGPATVPGSGPGGMLPDVLPRMPAAGVLPFSSELAAPEPLWKAVGTGESHRKLAAGRDPFSFAAALRSSQSEPFAPGFVPAASPSAMPAAGPAAPATGTQALTVPAVPAVSFKALGYAVSADGTAQAVLTDGNTLYVVNEGEEFAERFRVIAIRPEDLEVEDEVTNQTFRLPLGD